MSKELTKIPVDPTQPGQPGYVALVPTDEQADLAMKRLRATGGQLHIGDMAILGRTSRSKGMRDVARGVAMLGIICLQNEIQKMIEHRERLEKLWKRPPKDVLIQIGRISTSIVEIQEAIDVHNRTLLATEGTLAHLPTGSDDPPPVVQSFKPGQAVGPGTTTIHAQSVTINAPDAKPPVEPVK